MMGLPCRRCIPDDDLSRLGPKPSLLDIDRHIRERGVEPSETFRLMVEVEKKTEEFRELFQRAVGNRPWAAQLTWARRVFKKESFSIVAPTGIGKTVFGIVMSIYKTYVELERGKYKDKAYIVLPTTALVKQVYQKTLEFLGRLGLDPSHVVAYHSDLRTRERREVVEKILNGDFKILITTNQFLSTRFDLLSDKKFEFIFVDDVDAVLRSSKNIENIIILLMRRGRSKAETLRKDLKEILDALIEIRRASREGDPEKIAEYRRRVDEIKERMRAIGTLVISSATGRPRGIKVKLFKELLGFEVGLRSETIRNIVDTYLLVKSEDEALERLVYYTKILGRGGLIYVPVDKGVEYAKRLAEYLVMRGVRADYMASGRLTPLEKFLSGEIDVLIGVSIYYGVMVRGLDYPEHIRYAIFLGTPRFRFSARLTEPNVSQIAKTLNILKDIVPQEEIAYWHRLANKIIKTGTIYYIKRLNEVLQGAREPETKTERELLKALEYIRERLSQEEVREALKKHPEVVIEEEGGELYLVIPDVYTYIQASGRTSRLYAGGVTKGLSLVIETEEKLLRILIRRMEIIFEEARWSSIEEIDLEKLLREIDEDRQRVVMVRTGQLKAEFRDPIRPILIIVESPNKARTIARFFGRPSIRRRNGHIVYEVTTGDMLISVTATGGHIYDIVERLDEETLREISKLLGEELENIYGVLRGGSRYIPVYGRIKICRNGHQYIVPEKYEIDGETYEVCPKCLRSLRRKSHRKNHQEKLRLEIPLLASDVRDKGEAVDFIRGIASEVETVLVGTDPDTEGEKIGWDIASLVNPYAREMHRIEFHEVTRRAISNAIREKRELNERLVEAQLVRRIEDRWIGFELSRRIYGEISRERDSWLVQTLQGGWSAGRVQTPVLGWIVQRTEEADRNKKEGIRLSIPSLDIVVWLTYDELRKLGIDPGEIPRKTEEKEDGEKNVDSEILLQLRLGDEYTAEAKPPPPLTTDALLREASRLYGMDSRRTMRIAQELFESGLITYHRTDSTRISEEGMGIAKKYLETRYGEDGLRDYYPRRWGEGGAHEAIRPTRPLDVDTLLDMVSQGDIIIPINLSKDHLRIYGLIFDRFILSQLAPAKLSKRLVKLLYRGREIYSAELTIGADTPIKERFYRIVHPIKRIELRDGYVKALARHGTVYLVRFYTEGEVVEEMKRKGIGRPSTYASIIQTLKERRYVKAVLRIYLLATLKGKKAYRILSTKYGDLVSEERTRFVQMLMDMVERGEKDYISVLDELYEEIEYLRHRDSTEAQSEEVRTAGPRMRP